MDITTLRVFNSLYKLGITEGDISAIKAEQRHTERTGLFIYSVVRHKRKDYFVGVSHDEGHKIVIKESCDKIRASARILFKTLICFDDIPREIYALHGIAQYRSLDTEVKFVANSLDELKDRVCDRFADEYPKELGEEYEDVYVDSYYRKKHKNKRPPLVIEQLKALYWLFGEEYEEKQIFSRVNIPRIIKVYQRKNRRIALIQTNENWEARRGLCLREEIDRTIYEIKTYKPSNPHYNYVAPNREFAYIHNNDSGEVWLDDALFERIPSDELYAIVSKTSQNSFMLLTADKYNEIKTTARIEVMNKRRHAEEQEAKKLLCANIEKQFAKGSVTRSGITFSKKSMAYEGITIKGNDMDRFLVSQNIIQIEQPDFYEIYEAYIEYILKITTDTNYYPYSTEMNYGSRDKNLDLNIGNIKIVIGAVKGRGYLVNGYRIAKEDLEVVIKQAIQYAEQKDYDSFLNYTSKVCLRLQKALTEGIIRFELEIDSTTDNALSQIYGRHSYYAESNDKMVLALPILRENEKNYVIIKKEKLRVKNVKALLNLESGKYLYRYEGHLQKTIKQLHKSVSKITPQTIAELIVQGKKEYRKVVAKQREELKQKIQRSKEFLDNAVKLTKAFSVKGGLIVKGLSGNYYFVDKNGGAWTTKNKKKDQYLCLIDLVKDEAEGQAGLNDTIARRLLMLSKDKKVAREIWEKGDKMDKLWLKLQAEAMEA